MLRLFQESATRTIHSLDGEWYYCIDNQGNGKKENWQKALPETKRPIIIPSCFNNELGLWDYEGSVWIETNFHIKQPNVRVVFGAVNNECDVYLDGELLGSHYGCFTEFSFVVNGLEIGNHHLCVRVSNIHNNEDAIPLSNVDWYHYGGIIHSVCIIIWGLYNEVNTTTQAAKEVARLFRETLEKQDKSRLITYASNRPLDDICYEYADFISVNYYIGWYRGGLNKWSVFWG